MTEIKITKPAVALIDLGTGTDRSLIPLGIGLIASYLNANLPDELDVELFMMETDLEGLLQEMEFRFRRPPLVVGLACYVWNFNGVRAFARMLRRKWPSTLIVFGGPSVPMDSGELRSLFMKDKSLSLADNRPDIVVHMEGEITFYWIVKALLTGHNLREVKGISMFDCEAGSLVTTEKRSRIEDFTQIPSPYLSGIFDSVLKRYRKFIAGILWETNRGCPFKCSFCDWGNAAVNQVTKLDQDRVIEEIEWAARNGFEYVYCTDANYGINFKRDFEITRRIGQIKDRYGFPKTFVFNWTKNQSKNVIEIADFFRSHGIHTNTTISTQSFNPKVSIATQRANIRIEEYLKLKSAYHDRGLSTYSELILGLPEETCDSFIDGLEKSLSCRAYDQVMVYTANVLNNTQMKRDVPKYNIQTRKCNVGLNRRRFKVERFGEDDIVVSTNTMSVDEWKSCYCLAFLLLAFFNLRLAFYPLIYLKEYLGVRLTDVVKSIIDITSSRVTSYVVLAVAIGHIRSQAESILSSHSSVGPTRQSEGVVFTPNEAVAFIASMNVRVFILNFIRF